MEEKLPSSKHSVIPDLIGDPVLDSRFGSATLTILSLSKDRGNDKLKRLLHFFALVSLKEIYLTGRNFLGLVYHPFRTIKIMERERDKVQVLLIFGLPFYFWASSVMAVLLLRYFSGTRLFPMGLLAKTLLLLTSFLAGLIFSYLFYWAYVYLKNRKSNLSD